MLVVVRRPHESRVLYGSAETMFVRLQYGLYVRLYVVHAI